MLGTINPLELEQPTPPKTHSPPLPAFHPYPCPCGLHQAGQRLDGIQSSLNGIPERDLLVAHSAHGCQLVMAGPKR